MELLLSSNLATIKTFVQMMFDSVKDEVKSLREENTELKYSLEFSQSEIDSLKQTVQQQRTQINSLLNMSENASTVEDRVRSLEDFSRAKNLRISGLPELNGETSEQSRFSVQKLINEKLQVEGVEVKDAYRIGSSSGERSWRPIIAKLESTTQKFKCLKNGKNLKGSSIYINEDLSRATMQIRSSKLDELKRKRDEGYIAYFSGIDIVTRRKTQTSVRRTSISSNGSTPPAQSPLTVPPSALDDTDAGATGPGTSPLVNTNAMRQGPLNAGTGSGSSAVDNTSVSKQGPQRAGTVLGNTAVDNTNVSKQGPQRAGTVLGNTGVNSTTAPKQDQRAANTNATKLRPRK